MNPLAQLMRAWGNHVQGSDRSFDLGKHAELAGRLRAAGITLFPQDGSAITPQSGLTRFIYSTAVEPGTPEMRAASAAGLELVPRPTLLAEIVNQGTPGVAVAGTSGKSTITGMLAWILRCATRPVTVLSGAALVGEGQQGGFAAGLQGEAVIAEACESDGTLIGYKPRIGIIHNISRDHAEVAQLHLQFDVFARQSGTLLVNAACKEALVAAHGHPRCLRYGRGGQAELPLEVVVAGAHRAHGILGLPGGGELSIDCPQPGLHNLDNAAAAAAAALQMGIGAECISQALASFPGVARRFEIIGITDTGIRVIDDYAHNGEKIRAAITAAHAGCDRLITIFQPHGFGPARFLRDELKQMLPEVLRAGDRFCYSEIHYSGGTVAKDISSRDLAADLPSRLACGYAANHQELLAWVAGCAAPGDTVLLMGARDPELPNLARAIHGLL